MKNTSNQKVPKLEVTFITFMEFSTICFTVICICSNNTIHMYSGITSGRVLDGELLYTKILEVNLIAFAYRLFHERPVD